MPEHPNLCSLRRVKPRGPISLCRGLKCLDECIDFTIKERLGTIEDSGRPRA